MSLLEAQINEEKGLKDPLLSLSPEELKQQELKSKLANNFLLKKKEQTEKKKTEDLLKKALESNIENSDLF